VSTQLLCQLQLSRRMSFEGRVNQVTPL